MSTWREGIEGCRGRRPRWFRILPSLLLLSAMAFGAEDDCLSRFPEAPAGTAEAPLIRIWTPATLPADWSPPPCVTPGQGKFTLLLEGLATYPVPGGADEFLSRFADVSALDGIRYWSVTRQRWRPLVTAAEPLSAPHREAVRGDFNLAELQPGVALFLYQEENTPAAEVVYRTRVIERAPTRVVVEVENALPVKRFLLELFPESGYRFVHVFEKTDGERWRHYMLLRLDTSYGFLLAGHETSFINRMGALFRYFAGVPTDGGLPPAPDQTSWRPLW